MHAHAALTSELTDRGTSRLARLRSTTPLVLRPTIATGHVPLVGRDPSAARVALAAGAAGPVGGDEYLLDVTVSAGSTLVLSDISATLALPGPHGEPSRMRCRVSVEDGATLVWLPHPVIAAAGCRHEHLVDIDLAPDARLVYREELLLGRHAETPGDLNVHLAVRRAGRPLLVQHLALGPRARGAGGAAVVGDHRAVGSLLIVAPGNSLGPGAVLDARTALVHPDDPTGGTVLGIAVAVDAQELRRSLDRTLDALGEPWAATSTRGWSAVPR